MSTPTIDERVAAQEFLHNWIMNPPMLESLQHKLNAITPEELRSILSENEQQARLLGMSAERECDLRGKVERLTKQIKDDNRSYGCELRVPNDTIWEQAAKDHDRAEKAERELAAAQDEMAQLQHEQYAAERELDAARQELAALREDRERLDWLEGNAGDIPKYNSRSFVCLANQNIRPAIDVAREEAK